MDKIRQALHDKKLVIVVGAGISLSATRPSPSRITWAGLIRDGLDFLNQECYVAADDEELNVYRRILQQDNADMKKMLRACSYLKGELESNQKYPTWLESVFRSLPDDVTQPGVYQVFQKLHERGAKLLTTNYDELLEHFCKLQRVRRSIPEDIRKYEQGTLDGVFHIHGSFQDPQDVVLDAIDYYKIKSSDDVQNLLKTYLGHNTILFIGCSSGLQDPNFDALLKWTSNREENVSNHHYLLVRDGDNLKYNPLITLKHGNSHEDFVPYLERLLDLAEASTKQGTPSENNLVAQQDKALSWLATTGYKSHHTHISKQRKSGSGEWLLKKNEFTNWNCNNRSSILWLRGSPGTGKTFLSSLIIDKLLQSRESCQTLAPIAYFYCSRESSDLKRGDPECILRSIIRQIARGKSSSRVKPQLWSRYEKSLAEGDLDPLDLADSIDLVHELLEDDPATIIIDGFDECSSQDKKRNLFLEGLTQFVDRSPNIIKIFIASRDSKDIQQALSSHPKLIIEADDNRDDITKFVDSQVEFEGSKQGIADKLKQKIKQELAEKADGNFRWVQLSITSLFDQARNKLEDDIEDNLESLPRNLEKSYDVIYDQICCQRGPA